MQRHLGERRDRLDQERVVTRWRVCVFGV
jgi:hypothetical protein